MLYWALAVTLDISFVSLTDVDHLYRKENDETTKLDPASGQFSPVISMSTNPLAKELPMSPDFCGDQHPPPYWIDDGQPPSMTGFLARRSPELPQTASALNKRSRSPPQIDIRPQDAQGLTTGTDTCIFPGPVYHPNYLHKKRFSVNPVHEDVDAADDTKSDGLCHWNDSVEVGLDRGLEMEIDDLLEVLTDHHNSKRVTMMSTPLLPLPEEFSTERKSASPEPYPISSLLSPVTTNTLYGGDSDTPSLTSSSPRSSKDSHFSPSSPTKPKKSSTPITPSTDEWGSPLPFTTTPYREVSTSDLRHTRVSGRSEAYSPRRVPEDITSSSSHHENLLPARTVIPEDSTIQRRTKSSFPPEDIMTHDYKSRAGPLAEPTLSSHFSDDDASEITDNGYFDPEFDHAYVQPGTDSFMGRPGLGASGGRYSPTSSISPEFVDYPSPINTRNPPTPKRGILQSLFSQSGSFGQGKERKRWKRKDSVYTQPQASRSIETISLSRTSTKSSKERKKSEKAEMRAQLATQLKAKGLQQAADRDRETSPLTEKPSARWEENNAMYVMDGFL